MRDGRRRVERRQAVQGHRAPIAVAGSLKAARASLLALPILDPSESQSVGVS